MRALRGSRRLRRWAARLWLGCSARAWWMLLHRYRYAVNAPQLHIAAVDTILSPVNSFLGGVERLAFGRRVARQTVSDPLFVLGHWRTGTTLLHDLLALDPKNACPTTYQCCAPHHFLLTERALPP